MAVSVLVKNNRHKKISPPEIAKLSDLCYGAMDGNFVLVWDDIGRYTVLFDQHKIGRGFEVEINDIGVEMNLPLPNTGRDIEAFYDTIALLANQLGTGSFMRDGEIIGVERVKDYAEWDKAFSESTLRRFAKDINAGKKDSFLCYGALNPITLGKAEFDIIDGKLENFDKLLDDLQQKDVLYIAPKLYQRPNGEIFGLHHINEVTHSVIPIEPIFYSDRVTVKDYYVMIPGGNAIPHKEFIDNVPSYKVYDSGHIIVCLNADEINDLAQSFAVDCDTEERIPANKYYSRIIIDTGSRHSVKIQSLKLKCDPLAGLNHIAAFLKWAYKNDMLEEHLLSHAPEIEESVNTGSDLRLALQEGGEGMMLLGDFRKEYHGFIREFYKFNSNVGYPHCVDEYAEKFFGTKKYNSKAFKDEAYLFVPYDEAYDKAMEQYIDKAWEQYKNR